MAPMSEGDLAELLSQLLVAGPSAWAAFRQLAARGDEASLRVLCEQAQAPDWRYRRVAIEALASHALVSRARQVIVVALGDASPYVARTACEAVGRLAIPQARPGISALARDPDSATREAALRAWAAVWRPEDFEPVYQIYAQDKVEQVRREAAGLLRQHADAASWQRLFAAWSMAPFGRHRVWACELAARFGVAAAEAALRELLHDKDGHVRKAASRALAAAAQAPDSPTRRPASAVR